MNPLQLTTPECILFSFRLGSPHGSAFIRLPGFWYVAWNLEPDYDEQVVWECGKLNLTRPETDEEREDRLMGEEEAQSPNGSGTSELEGSTVVFTWNDDDGEYELSFPEGEEGDAELLEGLTEDMDFRALLPDGELSEGESYDIDLAGLVDVMAPGGDLKIEMEVDGADGAAMGPDPAMMSDFRQFFEDVVEGSATGKFVEMRDVDGVNVAVRVVAL